MVEMAGIAIIVIAASIFLLAAIKPDAFVVQRAIDIKAPPEKVFAQICDFRRWSAWSPWEKKDPGMKRTFGARTSGEGATYAWEGNKDVGQGSMEIMKSVPSARLKIRLDFLKPFEVRNIVEFTLEAQGDITRLTWAMHGPNPYFSKLMQVFVSMDKMVGRDFEAGLASLKAAAEQ